MRRFGPWLLAALFAWAGRTTCRGGCCAVAPSETTKPCCDCCGPCSDGERGEPPAESSRNPFSLPGWCCCTTPLPALAPERPGTDPAEAAPPPLWPAFLPAAASDFPAGAEPFPRFAGKRRTHLLHCVWTE